MRTAWKIFSRKDSPCSLDVSRLETQFFKLKVNILGREKDKDDKEEKEESCLFSFHWIVLNTTQEFEKEDGRKRSESENDAAGERMKKPIELLTTNSIVKKSDWEQYIVWVENI